MKKILAISIVLLVCFLSGCQENKTEKQPIDGSVSIVYHDQTIVSEEITTVADTAEDVLLEVCQKHKIPYRLNNHMFDGFGGYDSTQTDGWILYVNDEIADKGAYEMELENDFSVAFVYVNYSEVFFME